MTIGITGATGQLGRLTVERLKARTTPSDIRALVRTPAKAADLGVPVLEADYEKPETLDRALAGVGTLLLISSNEMGRRALQHGKVIESAKKAGVGHIVYTSLLHADTSRIRLLGDEHRATESALKASGIPFTVLRNGWYIENHDASIPAALAGGALLGSAGDGRISGAARADFADAAVAVLTNPAHQGKVHELAGDTAYTLADIAAEISRQSGKAIPYRNLPEAEYAAALAGFGLPPELARTIASWDTSIADGELFDDRRALSALIGRPTTPLRDGVAAVLERQV